MSFIPDDFLAGFALPLIAGGEVHIGRPLDGDDLQALRAEALSPGDTLVRVESLRLAAAQAMWVDPVDTPLDEDSLRLLVGLHNTLFLAHPDTDRLTVRDRRLEQLVAFTRACLDLAPPAGEAQLVARHTLFAHLVALRRTDTDVRFWVGSRAFRGQPVPERLLRWRGLRRVREERVVVEMLAATQLDEAQAELVGAIFAASPLTDLLLITRPAPALRWERLLSYLRQPRVARAVCYAYLEHGLRRIGPALSRSFWRLVVRAREGSADAEIAACKAALVVVAQLVQYLYVSTCLLADGEPEQVDADDPSAALCSVLVAAHGTGILAPAQQLGETLVQRRFDQLVAKGRAGLGENGQVLTMHLQQALQREKSAA